LVLRPLLRAAQLVTQAAVVRAPDKTQVQQAAAQLMVVAQARTAAQMPMLQMAWLTQVAVAVAVQEALLLQ
jgi:hypothetical protein